MPTGFIQVDGWLVFEHTHTLLGLVFPTLVLTQRSWAGILPRLISVRKIVPMISCMSRLLIPKRPLKYPSVACVRGPKLPVGHIGWPFSFILASTGQTSQRMQLILCDFGFYSGQFNNLMAMRLCIFSHQQCATILTFGRLSYNDLITRSNGLCFLPTLSVVLREGNCLQLTTRLQAIQLYPHHSGLGAPLC